MRVKVLLVVLIVFYKINLNAAEAGMPQLDPTYWFSQAFWLILIFSLLYISIAKFFIPKIKDNLDDLQSKNISSEITQYENKELKELINDYVSSADKILAKIIVDHESPFLKSIIINKGSKDNLKIIRTNSSTL